MACMLVASFMAATISAATPGSPVASSRPSLLLGIFINGLDADKLELLKEHFGPDGFNRLMDQGVTLESVEFGPGADAAAATTMIVTGTSPVVNGIPALKVYDVSKKVEYPIFAASSKGDFNDLNFSPSPILTSTISDEAKISTDGVGLAYGIAPEAWQAVILAGHAANSANYIDSNTGQWVTPRYYKELALPVNKRNSLLPLSARLDTISWIPSRNLESYPGLPDYKKQFPFRHTFSKKNPDRYLHFKSSAPANRETAQTAIDFIQSLSLGSRGVLDVMNMAFDVTPYPYGREGDVELENLDAYLRLDADLAKIFNAIDHSAGLQNTVILVAGLPGEPMDTRIPDSYNIPTGQFSPQRALSLLNLYLMAIHGNGDYVLGYNRGYFYLNRDLIRERDLNLQNLRIEAADFLSRMSGVSETFTIDDIRAGRAGDNGAKLRLNTSLTHAGDILIRINPGWEISDESVTGTKANKKGATKVFRPVLSQAPAFILAPELKQKVISTPVDARTIAPTVTRLLRIRSPNASTLPPLKIKDHSQKIIFT